MESLNKKTVGQIVAEDYRTAQVFQKFGLDFCCGGNKTIEEAAAEKNVNSDAVKEALENLEVDGTEHNHYNEWPLDFLVDYIINNHHKYCRTALPKINFYTKKVLSVHGREHPELEEIYYELVKLYSEMIEHLDDEETVLFPYIRKLAQADETQELPQTSEFGTIANPIAMMEEEHDEAGEAMANIRRLSDNFTPPGDACATYNMLFKKLQAFEKDLHKHVHLENNILFPKALELDGRRKGVQQN